MKKILLTPYFKGMYALVSDEDYEFLNKYKWNAWQIKGMKREKYYAVRNGHKGEEVWKNRQNCGRVYMHRYILNFPSKNYEIDHVNGNGLDNRRDNLRACTHKENMRNMSRHSDKKSPFKGVYPSGRKWEAKIAFTDADNKLQKLYLGTFVTSEEARIAYNNASRKYHGTFSKLSV